MVDGKNPRDVEMEVVLIKKGKGRDPCAEQKRTIPDGPGPNRGEMPRGVWGAYWKEFLIKLQNHAEEKNMNTDRKANLLARGAFNADDEDQINAESSGGGQTTTISKLGKKKDTIYPGFFGERAQVQGWRAESRRW